MTGLDGGTLREWRRSRGWDVPALERKLRRAVGSDPVPVDGRRFAGSATGAALRERISGFVSVSAGSG